MFLKSDVVYDANLVNAQEIATAIEDLGFDTQVLDDTANSNEKVNLLVIFQNAFVFDLFLDWRNDVRFVCKSSRISFNVSKRSRIMYSIIANMCCYNRIFIGFGRFKGYYRSNTGVFIYLLIYLKF